MTKLLPLLVLATCVATTLGTQNEYEAAVMADNPTAYFQLRDAPASATQTNEVTTRHLNRVGTFTPQSFTRSDLAFTSAIGQRFQVASHSDFSSPAGVDFSLEIFTYATSGATGYRSPVTNRQYPGAPGGGTWAGYNLYVSPTNQYELWYASGAFRSVGGGNALFDQWVHLAFSHNASQNKGHFFVNGVETATLDYALIQRTSTSDPLYLGVGLGYELDYGWVGSLSDLAMFHSFIPGSTWVSRLALNPLVPAIPPTLDPAVAAYCDDIADKCTAMSTECDSIRNGHGPLVGAGTMTNQAGKNNIGEQTGGVTLTGNSVVVTAVGTMYCTAFSCPTSPDGGDVGTNNFLLNGVPKHSLLARFGNTGPWQYVGAGPTTLTGTGPLTFAYNDDNNNYADNNGSWFITIRDDITNVADDCDATVAACNDVHADCVVKVGNCPLV